jgi:hypothetical protein
MDNQTGFEQLDQWAAQITDRGLSQPAALLLTACAPFSWLLGQFYLFSQPFLAGILPAADRQALGVLLQEESAWHRFVEQLRTAGGEQGW